MKITIQLLSDTDNTYCDNVPFSLETTDFEKDIVYIEIDERRISVNKNDLKKALSIL